MPKRPEKSSVGLTTCLQTGETLCREYFALSQQHNVRVLYVGNLAAMCGHLKSRVVGAATDTVRFLDTTKLRSIVQYADLIRAEKIQTLIRAGTTTSFLDDTLYSSLQGHLAQAHHARSMTARDMIIEHTAAVSKTTSGQLESGTASGFPHTALRYQVYNCHVITLCPVDCSQQNPCSPSGTGNADVSCT